MAASLLEKTLENLITQSEVIENDKKVDCFDNLEYVQSYRLLKEIIAKELVLHKENPFK